MTAKVYQFQFPGSGVIATVRGVSPTMVATDVRRGTPRPKPPVSRVNYGTDADPDWRAEENPADPSYQAALNQWDEEVSLRAINLTIQMALTPHRLTEDDLAEVSTARAMLLEAGVDLSDTSDKMVWFRYVACAGDADWKGFLEFIRRVGEPSGVDAIREGFRS